MLMGPLEGLVERTMALLTFGRLTGEAATTVVAALESAIGLSLLTGRLFVSRVGFVPTLEAQ
jgi:hypothetical protein